MLILVTGDLHLTDKTPTNRIDDYPQTCLNKFKFILDTAKEHNVDLIIQPGDFFDTPNPSWSLFTKIAKMIKYHDIPLFTVFGQHDLRFRTKKNTALKALKVACPNLILDNKTMDDYVSNLENEGVCIHTSGWEESIPKPKIKTYNILITHRMIIQKKLWEDQEHFVYGDKFLKDNKFNLIVSGDNHQYFVFNIGDRWLFNCGSMMRSNITQTEHKPQIILFETHSQNWAEFDIPIKPVEEVFSMDQIIKTKERNEKMEAFVDGLSAHKDMGLSFEDNLQSYCTANEVDPVIYQLIKGCFI